LLSDVTAFDISVSLKLQEKPCQYGVPALTLLHVHEAVSGLIVFVVEFDQYKNVIQDCRLRCMGFAYLYDEVTL